MATLKIVEDKLANMALDSYIRNLLKYLGENQDKTAEERLLGLMLKLREDHKTAKDGWL